MLKPMSQQRIITIGNFDGVHIGHRVIIDQAVKRGKLGGMSVVALTFDPHPMRILQPGREPLRLMNRSEKVNALRGAGADDVVVLEPTRELLSLSPQEFVQRVVDQYQPAAIVEGPNFRFGKDRAGDVQVLMGLGKEYGFEVQAVEQVEISLSDQLTAPVSSSLIRWLLSLGRVADAAKCLSQGYGLTGQVIQGACRGRSIGVPTANLDLSAALGQVVPGNGVYAGRVHLTDGAAYTAAISVGVQATFGGDGRTVEAHLLDFSGDLYDQSITIRFVRWVREQRRFSATKALQEQIERDMGQIRQWDQMNLLGESSWGTPQAKVGCE